MEEDKIFSKKYIFSWITFVIGIILLIPILQYSFFPLINIFFVLCCSPFATKFAREKNFNESLLVLCQCMLLFIVFICSGAARISGTYRAGQQLQQQQIIAEQTTPEPSESPTSPEPTTEPETIPEATEPPTEDVTEPETEAQTEKAVETTSKMKVDNNFISNHDSQIIAAATLALENFITDYDMSLAPQRWTIAPFDDNDTVMTTVDISYNGKSGKYIYVGTLEINQKTGRIDSAQPHFLYVIDTVLGDDGYCDDFFAKINALG